MKNVKIENNKFGQIMLFVSIAYCIGGSIFMFAQFEVSNGNFNWTLKYLLLPILLIVGINMLVSKAADLKYIDAVSFVTISFLLTIFSTNAMIAVAPLHQ